MIKKKQFLCLNQFQDIRELYASLEESKIRGYKSSSISKWSVTSISILNLGSDESPSPDTQLMLESLREEIRRALDTLTPREADVVSSYFGLNARRSCK